jgi:hypothetical protein
MTLVMPGLDPGIHAFPLDCQFLFDCQFLVDCQDVDGLDICVNARKTRFALLPGHDGVKK